MQPVDKLRDGTEVPEEYSTRISNIIRQAETAEEAYREVLKCIEENLLFEKRHLELFLSRFLPTRWERKADHLNISPDEEPEQGHVPVAEDRWAQIISLVSELYTCSQTRHRFPTYQLVEARDEYSHHQDGKEGATKEPGKSLKTS